MCVFTNANSFFYNVWLLNSRAFAAVKWEKYKYLTDIWWNLKDKWHILTYKVNMSFLQIVIGSFTTSDHNFKLF